GCSACYGVFTDGLSGMLKNMHKGTAHTGKSPAAFHKIREQTEKMKSLHDSLNQAVASEEYERAADLRDQIRQIEAGASA
ncbi:MAG: UvrB/UvrC motif-containing protein, partial [Verrucomicrobiota bacterium]